MASPHLPLTPASDWYHGSAQSGLTQLRPDQETNFPIDRPRPGAIYLTRNVAYALSFGPYLYRAQDLDASLLLPDEDAVLDLLEELASPLASQLGHLWLSWRGDSWVASSERLLASDDFSALSQAMIDFTDFLVANHPKVAEQILANSFVAAYVGPLAVIQVEAPVASAPEPDSQLSL
jgi:hypothetical protein